MSKRNCRGCSKPFIAERGFRYCKNCLTKRTKEKRLRECRSCHKIFLGSFRFISCPRCRIKENQNKVKRFNGINRHKCSVKDCHNQASGIVACKFFCKQHFYSAKRNLVKEFNARVRNYDYMTAAREKQKQLKLKGGAK